MPYRFQFGETKDDGYWLRALTGVVTVAALDSLWLGAAAPSLGVYSSYLDYENNDPKRGRALGALYFVVAGMVTALVVAKNNRDAAAAGAILGFYSFFTYNVVTLALTSGRYPVSAAVTDVTYGTAAIAAVTVLQHKVSQYSAKRK